MDVAVGCSSVENLETETIIFVMCCRQIKITISVRTFCLRKLEIFIEVQN